MEGKSQEEIRELIAHELKSIQNEVINSYIETEKYEKVSEMLSIMKKRCLV